MKSAAKERLEREWGDRYEQDAKDEASAAQTQVFDRWMQESGLASCDGGDGWGCFIPHAHCVCEDEGTPGMRRVENLHVGAPNPETKWS